MKRAVLYLRVSTIDQTTANQERELQAIAARMGCEIAKVYKDHGISGAKGRDKRPAFNALCKAAARREFDMVMAWSVDSRAQPSGLGCLPVRASRTAHRPIPSPAGHRHHDTSR
jgi:DNA invertase Pin-like site-specific DNA recombinase